MAKRIGCPICGKPTEQEFTPFCSRGCKDRDLLQWLGEGYRIPAEPVELNAQTGLDTERDAD